MLKVDHKATWGTLFSDCGFRKSLRLAPIFSILSFPIFLREGSVAMSSSAVLINQGSAQLVTQDDLKSFHAPSRTKTWFPV
jgi:hypothetical protein